MEQIIKLTDVNVDGCGNDVTTLVRVSGKDITADTVDNINRAIGNYKKENEGEWDTNGCLDVAREQLESEGFKVHFINPLLEICF